MSPTPTKSRSARDPESIFEEFVRNSNQIAGMERTVQARLPDFGAAARPSRPEEELDLAQAEDLVELRADEFEQLAPGNDESVLLLTRRKLLERPVRPDSYRAPIPGLLDARCLPDAASVGPPPPPLTEASDDGHMPAGVLDRVLMDIQVLRRYGHDEQVDVRLADLFAKYPNDLLLLRRMAEFHLEAGDTRRALDTLFILASRLFDRGTTAAMGEVLEQILGLDPGNTRALKLLGLLGRRPAANE